MSSSCNHDLDDLPNVIYDEICRIILQNNKWMILAAKFMNYNTLAIQEMARHQNPMKEFMIKLSATGQGTDDLFKMLSMIHDYNAMSILQPYVDKEHHYLLDVVRGNLENAQKDRVAPSTSINNNHHDTERKILNQRLQLAPSNSNNLNVLSPNSLNLSITNSTMTFSSLIEFLKGKPLRNIPYQELAESTDNWNENRILGKGGFGKVFRGYWKNTHMAIKRIEKKENTTNNQGYLEQLHQSLREITILQSFPHDNILALYAYSINEDSPPCLVYQYMSNGSLQDNLMLLKKKAPLSWKQRHDIAKSVARGLQYLHGVGTKPLIHGDIKSANILLDDHMIPKIGDFGLAREIIKKEGVQVTRRQGTSAYLPKDYLGKKILSTKVDTYSYGIVMYEITTGLLALDKSRDIELLKDYVASKGNNKLQLIDKKAGEMYNNAFYNLIQIGDWCTHDCAEIRPEMAEVFNKINEVK